MTFGTWRCKRPKPLRHGQLFCSYSAPLHSSSLLLAFFIFFFLFCAQLCVYPPFSPAFSGSLFFFSFFSSRSTSFISSLFLPFFVCLFLTFSLLSCRISFPPLLSAFSLCVSVFPFFFPSGFSWLPYTQQGTTLTTLHSTNPNSFSFFHLLFSFSLRSVLCMFSSLPPLRSHLSFALHYYHVAVTVRCLSCVRCAARMGVSFSRQFPLNIFRVNAT